MKGLTEGRIVHFVLAQGICKGQHRAAVVVGVFRMHDGTPPANGCSNLQVLLDGSNDAGALPTDPRALVAWETSRVYDPTYSPGSWHWPQDCAPKEAGAAA